VAPAIPTGILDVPTIGDLVFSLGRRALQRHPHPSDVLTHISRDLT
jgi:hypothetical protein